MVWRSESPSEHDYGGIIPSARRTSSPELNSWSSRNVRGHADQEIGAGVQLGQARAIDKRVGELAQRGLRQAHERARAGPRLEERAQVAAPPSRKHLPTRDVAEAGGWRDMRSLEHCYQQVDEATLLAVVTEPRKLRDVSNGSA